MNGSLHLWLIPLLPFAGFLINGILGGKLPRWLVTTVGLLAPLASFAIVLGTARGLLGMGPGASLPYVETPWHWINAGIVHVNFSFVLDQLSLIMLLIITGVGFLIHLYSVGYMHDDAGYARFFSYLNLFLFFMTTLVLAGNVLLMFVGWEGVGLASYLLIGFWFTKDSAANAGKKAFVVNRVGDFGFLIGIFLLLGNFGTLNFSAITAHLNANFAWQGGVLNWIAICLLFGAAGKSAQLPLYVWLPDAMEGPTPVSALIHAATMVTAGVYMICRTHVLFSHAPIALDTVAAVGAATAIFAATMGLVQNDIKRVLAYSTISQLGYMFLGCGVAAYSAAIFHLMTHAFFKALLFLGAGAVIHSLGGEQDMRKMGGLWKKMPVTFATMTAAVLAICGIFPFAGFFSKDAILYAAYLHGTGGKILWAIGVITALITALYMFRLWYMTFLGRPKPGLVTAHGSSRAESKPEISAALAPADLHPHSTPLSMLVPMVILGVLSICGGWMGIERFGGFLSPALGPMKFAGGSAAMELWLSIIAVALALEGWFIIDKYYRRKPERPAQLAKRFPAVHRVLLRKYYVDEIYGAAIVRPLLAMSSYILDVVVDKGILGGAAWLLAGTATMSGAILQRWQSGNIRSYAAWLAAGAAAVLLFVVIAWASAFAGLGLHIRMVGH
ncbi:MAG TPA: NADH-quinone oxidoreductase subunit L [Candidatus Angelobacter sp.]|nr:NADH-quinone oxidoreductase subunit L [Candidatus Angelobacter sp.]